MTNPKLTSEDVNPSTGNIRSGLAVIAMIVMLTLGTAVTALAGGGGIGPGGGGGDGGGDQAGGERYDREWDSFSAKDKKWARKTSQCEAGQDPNIHSPGKDYHGAFQFLKSTWKAAPMSKGNDPHRFGWKVQAVVAVKWMHKAGKGQWPVCG
jgi:Transglycosylase-like domain